MSTNVVHGTTSGFQVETELQSSRIVATARLGVKLTGAGMCAVLAVLDTYYGSLSATQKASLPGLCSVGSTQIVAYVVPGTQSTAVSTLLNTTLSAAGNTAVG